MPIRFRSRQVKCMLMSSPVASRTSIAVGRTDIRTRPSEPSLMSTISTPRSLRSLAPCTSFSMLWPRGGSSSTVTRNSPASSRRWSRVGGALVARPVGSAISTRARRAGSARAALRWGTSRSSASRIARMCCGVVPQQPPTRRAPLAIIRAA